MDQYRDDPSAPLETGYLLHEPIWIVDEFAYQKILHHKHFETNEDLQNTPDEEEVPEMFINKYRILDGNHRYSVLLEVYVF